MRVSPNDQNGSKCLGESEIVNQRIENVHMRSEPNVLIIMQLALDSFRGDVLDFPDLRSPHPGSAAEYSLRITCVENQYESQDGDDGDDDASDGEPEGDFAPDQRTVPVTGNDRLRPTGKNHCKQPCKRN